MFKLILLGILVVAVGTWALVTQPTLATDKLAFKPLVTVDPARLEFHVRILSEEFFPRDEAHAENLDRAAAYIRKEFEQASGTVSEPISQIDWLVAFNTIGFQPE